MRKVLVNYNVDEIALSDSESAVSADSSYDLFHSTIGVVAGNIAAEFAGLEGVLAKFGDGIRRNRYGDVEIGTATFYYEKNPGQFRDIATVYLVLE